jgi:hypothetical protein
MRILRLFVCACFPMCVSCNIKAPLEGIWTASNQLPAAWIQLSAPVDTFSLSTVIYPLNSVDSITGKGLSIRSLGNVGHCYVAAVTDSSVFFHPIGVYKDGQKVTLMACYASKSQSAQTDSIFSIAKGFLNNRLLFECRGRPSELYVLWQNSVLPARFIHFSKGGFSVLIPKEAKPMKRSCLRVFWVCDTHVNVDSRTSLIYGLPELDSTAIINK